MVGIWYHGGMTSPLLPNGLSFNDPDLIQDTTPQPEASLISKIKKTQLVDFLCENVAENRSHLVMEVLNSLSKSQLESPKTKDKIVDALTKNREVDHAILDMLEGKKLIERRHLIIQMRALRNYSAAAWLLRDRENIQLAEINAPDNIYRKNNDGKPIRSVAKLVQEMVYQGRAAEVATLDIGWIFRNHAVMRDHDIAVIFKDAMRCNSNTPEDISKLAEKLWDPATWTLMHPDKTEKQLKELLVQSCHVVVKHVIHDKTENYTAGKFVERVLQHSPRLAKAMEEYWLQPQEYLRKIHPGRWTHIDHEKIETVLPGIKPIVYRDLLDCAIWSGAYWVVDAIGKPGKLHDELFRRLNEDDGPLMAGILHSIHPADYANHMVSFIKLISPQWCDTQGRGLGHYLVKAGNGITVSSLAHIARHKRGLDLLSQEVNGETPICFLERHEDWKSKNKTQLLDNLKHRLLTHIATKHARDNKQNVRVVYKM